MSYDPTNRLATLDLIVTNPPTASQRATVAAQLRRQKADDLADMLGITAREMHEAMARVHERTVSSKHLREGREAELEYDAMERERREGWGA